MAGDWIKIEHSLPAKPEVFAIAARVGQNRAEVVGRLILVWSWMDEITDSGTGLRIASNDIDDIAGTPGFAEAMREAGWLTGRDLSLQVPNFQRHNGTSAKARALESEAKRLRRLSGKSSDHASDICPTKSAVNVRPEKRREERKKNKQKEIFRPPDVEAVRAYCLERKNEIDPERFVNYYASKGWKVGKAPMRDWKAAVRTWEQNAADSTKPKQRVCRVATKEDVKNWNPYAEPPQ